MNANTDQLNAKISANSGNQLTASPYSVQTSAFPDANDIRIKNSSLSITTNVNTTSKPMETLYQRVAPHAISNEGGRADNPKCHPGTREEVIGLLERWMDAAESDQILWLSGPAGGGKTAIVKTLTERATDRGARTISFYFFRGDSTRNGAEPVVPTLLYQLFQLYPRTAEVIAGILFTHPRALDGSVVEQFKLVSRLIPIIQQLLPAGARILILIDGLDECDVGADISQGEIIRALASLVMAEDSPFRLLVASRPEARIRMAFNRLSSPAQTIFLDEQYSPEKDIRVFVAAEFDEIKASHPSAHLLGGDWPLSSDVDKIVRKSSGQFIYAATVMRYLSHPSTVPSLSLERVQGIVPAGKNSPFTHLDSIYTFILAQADDPDVMHDVLSLALLPEIRLEHTVLLHYYKPCYSRALTESCISQLSAIVQLTKGHTITFYHASLADFLVDPHRSGVYWADVNAFREKVLIAIWEKPSDMISYLTHTHWSLFDDLQRPSNDITHMLLNLPLPSWATFQDVNSLERKQIQSYMIGTVHKVYDAEQKDIGQQIIQRLEAQPEWLPEPTITPSSTKSRLFSSSWWHKTLHIRHSKK